MGGVITETAARPSALRVVVIVVIEHVMTCIRISNASVITARSFSLFSLPFEERAGALARHLRPEIHIYIGRQYDLRNSRSRRFSTGVRQKTQGG